MLTLAIQAGGKSSRMGQDKGITLLLGKPLIVHVLERLKPIADEILVTTNQPNNYQFLGLPLIPDQYTDRGALGGLHTALAAAHYPFVAVVACDMPFANANLFNASIQILLHTNADAVIPRSINGLEPLHAVYRKDTCLQAVKKAIDDEQWKLISWHANVSSIVEIPFEKVTQLDPDGRTFFNVNTPEDLHFAENIINRKMKGSNNKKG